jgi:hypothetical protein
VCGGAGGCYIIGYYLSILIWMPELTAAEGRCGKSGGDCAWDIDWICRVIISFNISVA